MGTRCATSRKVAGSIPDDIVGIFLWRSPYSRYMALGYLVEGKGGRPVGVTTLPPSGADCLEILGAPTSKSVMGLVARFYQLEDRSLLRSLYPGNASS